MGNLIENINKRGIRFVLTEANFLANDYEKYPNNAELNSWDKVGIKDINETEIVVSLSRKIESPSHDFFYYFVSFDILFPFSEQNTNFDLDESEKAALLRALLKEYKRFFNNCMAKISLIVSQLSANVADSVPIVTPPMFFGK